MRAHEGIPSAACRSRQDHPDELDASDVTLTSQSCRTGSGALPTLLGIWQGERAIPQALDKGAAAQVRLDPSPETPPNRLAFIELIGDRAQLDRYLTGFVEAWTRTARHAP